MAKLSDLVPVMAEVLGKPEATVAVYARHLRAARMISTAGRGPGGADMSSEDCITLLEAMMGGGLAKDAPKFIGSLKRMFLTDMRLSKTIYNDGYSIHKQMPFSFHEDMVHLLDRILDGRLGKIVSDDYGKEFLELEGNPIAVRVKMNFPAMRARISVIKKCNAEKTLDDYMWNNLYILNNNGEMEHRVRRDPGNEDIDQKLPDMDTATSISSRTFIQIANLLKS